MRSVSASHLFISLSLATGALVAAVSVALTRSAETAEPRVTVSILTPTAPQGGTAFLLIYAPGAEDVRVRYGERALPAGRRAEGQWEALVGIFRDDAPGVHPLTIEADIEGQTAAAEAAVTVTPRTFPAQRLRMSASQEAKYSAPSVREEYRLIHNALAQESPRRWSGAFRLPTQGRISTPYGAQRYRNGKKVNVHKGVDISAPRGTLVCAANAGTVALRRDFVLHGRTLVINHGGGVVGVYLHLSEFGVSEGQQVAAGQKIARVGSTGAATGPHLHYALYVHGVPVDPLLWDAVPQGW